MKKNAYHCTRNVPVWFNLAYLWEAKLFPTEYVYFLLEMKFTITQSWNTLRQILTATPCTFRLGMYYMIIITLILKVNLGNCFSLFSATGLGLIIFAMFSSVSCVSSGTQDILTLFNLLFNFLSKSYFPSSLWLSTVGERVQIEKWFIVLNQIKRMMLWYKISINSNIP